MVEKTLRARLLSQAPVTTLVGTRIYPNGLPQDPVLPAVTYRRISGQHIHSHSGVSNLINARIQFNCYAAEMTGTGYGVAKSLAKAVRNALDSYVGADANADVRATLVLDDRDAEDTDRNQQFITLDVMVIYKEV